MVCSGWFQLDILSDQIHDVDFIFDSLNVCGHTIENPLSGGTVTAFFLPVNPSHLALAYEDYRQPTHAILQSLVLFAATPVFLGDLDLVK